VHFGLGHQRLVDVEVTVMTSDGRQTSRISAVDPDDYRGRWMVVKVNGTDVEHD
jgi:hypothetical protein